MPSNRQQIDRTSPAASQLSLLKGFFMRNKRLLFCIPTLDPGGAERVASILCNGLVKAGYDVTILLDHSADLQKCIYPLDARIQIAKLPPEKFSSGLLQLWETRRNFLKYKADCIIGFLWKTNVAISISLQFCRTPVILSEQSNMSYDLSNFNKKGLFLLRRGFRHVDIFVLQTEAIKRFLLQAPWSIPEKIIRVIPNPVRQVQIQKQLPKFRYPRIIAIGRLIRLKGFDLLLSAFAEAAEEFPEWQLDIFGQGPLREELEKQRDQLGLENRVHFRGITTDIDAELERSDIFVLASRIEGFPNVLLEAMAAGVAVIAADCRFGPGEIIDDGNNGLLVPAENIPALTQALKRLMSDAGLRGKLGNAARVVQERYAEEKIVNRWKNLIEEVCG